MEYVPHFLYCVSFTVNAVFLFFVLLLSEIRQGENPEVGKSLFRIQLVFPGVLVVGDAKNSKCKKSRGGLRYKSDGGDTRIF